MSGQDLGQRPTSKCFQSFPPCLRGWHEDQSTQDEAITVFQMLVMPRNRIVTNRVTEVTRDERRPLRAQGGNDYASNMPAVFSSMPLAIFLCQASQVADVVVSAHVDA
jgi:hypothetical protein